MDAAKLAEAQQYALTGGGSGYITRYGRLVLSWGDAGKTYDLKSTTKSFGSLALGLAILDGKVRLEDKARLHHPNLGRPPETNPDEWLEKITLLHLASQTAGFEKPGGYTRLLFEPGTKWDYSDSVANWLAECLTLAYHRDLDELMFERLFTPIGIGRKDLFWRKNAYRPATIEGAQRREFGAGIHANVDAMARIGYLMLRKGNWRGQQLLPSDYCANSPKTPHGHEELAVLNPADYGKASRHYGLLWWNNEDGTLPGVPRNAFWSWGLYDSLIVVMPSLDVVVARAGQSWKRKPNADHYEVLQPFFAPIVASVTNNHQAKSSAPYPASPVIRQVRWAPANQIVRLAHGSDNWPMTWADDDSLYTAYGDGFGFEPFVEKKLSLGLAKVTGMPPAIEGMNIRSATAEALGDGHAGRKACGMLCVDGVLYMLARNTGNAQLAWSSDHGQTWEWAKWKFTTSFGCPTFLNFGRNYSGARDEFVYVYSQDSDSAYAAADRFVLARVPMDRLREEKAYEYFAGFSPDRQPTWSRKVEDRQAVFSHPGRCYRSGISFNPGLKRYLWVQVLAESPHPQGPRFQGGFGIYDAPEPWGPWTTVYFTEAWDTGPGETASFPTKWISADGTRARLVFSGEDHFSVRKCEFLRTAESQPAFRENPTPRQPREK